MNESPASNIDAQRQQLRRTALQARQALSLAAWQTLSNQLEQRLFPLLQQLIQQHPAPTLGAYWPIKQEFDARPLIARLLAEHPQLRVCLPVVTAPRQPLEFRHWHPGSPMHSDRYGIAYPATGDWLLPDLLLIPVNAFDAQGYRLGYGSGYYDRTLAAMTPRPLCLGLGFELGRVANILPGAHDVPLDAIITESTCELHNPQLRLAS